MKTQYNISEQKFLIKVEVVLVIFNDLTFFYLGFSGILIGAQGKNVKHLRAATKCEVTLVTQNYEGRVTKAKKYDTEPQVSLLLYLLSLFSF